MKKILLYAMLACITAVMPMTINAAEAYAALSNDNTTLTFYYDNEKNSRNGMGIGPFESSKDRGWDGFSSDILTVIFDDSFAQYTDLQSTAYWFEGISKPKSIIGIENLKTSNVIDMSRMFYSCKSLTSLDVSNFDTRNVKNMSCMFRNCRSLQFIDLRNFDTQNVENMERMFEECQALESIDLSSFNTEKVTTMESMFENCYKSLVNINVSSFNTSNVTNMRKMFEACMVLKVLDLSSFNTSNVTNMRSMFSEDSTLTTIYVSDKWSTAKVEDGIKVFSGCYNIVGGSGTTYDENHKDYTYAHIDGGPSNPGYLTTKGTMKNDYMFTALTKEGVEMSFRIISINEKTCEVTSGIRDQSAIDASTSGFITIPEVADGYSVIGIGIGAFYGCENITDVSIPNSVTYIDGWGFYSCKSLTTIDIPQNVNSIGQCSFRSCTSLTKFVYPEAVKTIDYAVLSFCSSLVSVQLPSKAISMDWAAFEGCSSLKSIEIPITMASIGKIAFRYCTSLKSVKIFVEEPFPTPLDVFSVYDSATLYVPKGTKEMYKTTACWSLFSRIEEMDDDSGSTDNPDLKDGDVFTALTEEGVVMTFQILSVVDKTCQVGIGTQPAISTSTTNVVTIPKEVNGYSVVKIANRAFKGCEKITIVNIPNSITDIGTADFESAMGSFHECYGLIEMDIPNSVTTIGRGAMGHCRQLKTLRIPESVTYIGSNAFDGCIGLESIELSPNISAILLETFRNCKSLISIVIPAGVTTIGNNAFKGCTSLTIVRSEIEKPFIISDNVFTNYDATLYVPLGTKEKYKALSAWNKFFNIFEYEGETAIDKVCESTFPSAYYNLQGQRIDHPRKGLYIKNGKKVIK